MKDKDCFRKKYSLEFINKGNCLVNVQPIKLIPKIINNNKINCKTSLSESFNLFIIFILIKILTLFKSFVAGNLIRKLLDRSLNDF